LEYSWIQLLLQRLACGKYASMMAPDAEGLAAAAAAAAADAPGFAASPVVLALLLALPRVAVLSLPLLMCETFEILWLKEMSAITTVSSTALANHWKNKCGRKRAVACCCWHLTLLVILMVSPAATAGLD
jgi:hypothetical protein